MANVINFREGSVVSKMYNELKDGKARKFSAFRTKYVKAGLRPYAFLLRLDRIIRTQTGTHQINLSKRYDYVQLVPIAKALQLRESFIKANPVSAATRVSKTAKSVSKKKSVKINKAKAVKQVAVAVGADYEEEGLE